MTRLRPAALLLFAALPGAAWAACNPTGTQVCCEKHEAYSCLNVDWAAADHAELASIECNIASFELVGLVPGRERVMHHIWWVALDGDTRCPGDEDRIEEDELDPLVEWLVWDTHDHSNRGTGVVATSSPEMSGVLACVFYVRNRSSHCGEHEETYDCWATLPPTINSLTASSTVSYDGDKSFPVTTDDDIPDPLPADSLIIPRYKVTDEKDSTVSEYVVELVANPNTAEMETRVGDAEWEFLKGPASGSLVYESPLVSQVDTPCVGGHYIYKWHSCDTYPWGKAGVLLPLGGPDITEYLKGQFSKYGRWADQCLEYLETREYNAADKVLVATAWLIQIAPTLMHKAATYQVGDSPYIPLCDNTVTISGHVFGKDQIGNFLYAFLGAKLNLRYNLVLFGGRYAAGQAGTTENEDDIAAYRPAYDCGRGNKGSWEECLNRANIREIQNDTARIAWPSSDVASGPEYPLLKTNAQPDDFDPMDPYPDL